MNFTLGNIKIEVLHDEITFDEAKRLAEIEIEEAEFPLNRITINLDEDTQEYIVQAFRRSPITRIRRITGYLSELQNFNEAKRQEESNRFTHQNSEHHICHICGSQNTYLKNVMERPGKYGLRIICNSCKAERRV